MAIISKSLFLLSLALLAVESHGWVTVITSKHLLRSSLSMGDNKLNSELNGLLQGINDLKSSSFYSDNYNENIIMKTSLWDAAVANSKYLSAEDHIARCEKNIVTVRIL
jgi:hypothetical protein